MSEFSELKGKTLININVIDNEVIEFKCTDGSEYRMSHEQECCEYVTITDINGDINDLIGSEILLAEERSNNESTDIDSTTWTFYSLATVKGYVDITWQGNSNGYYSECANFYSVI